MIRNEFKQDIGVVLLGTFFWGVLLVLCDVTRGADLRPLFDAIRQVETGNMRNPAAAVGDQGRSIGPYQIQRAYWKDSGVPGRYEQVRERAYAERVMVGYWKRYQPDALKRGDFETLARAHNGGGHFSRRLTDGYWRKVRGKLR